MAEFADVVRRRRMTRAFRRDSVPRATVAGLVDLATRAPSAGKSQGWRFVALDGADTDRFWDVTLPPERRAEFTFGQLLDAPVIILPFADPQAYVDRYSEPDKANSGLGAGPDAWPTPYWTVDTAMAVMTLLHAAEDAGLGALFFAVFNGEAALRASLGVPERVQLLGAVALGWPLDEVRPGRSASRPRTPALSWGSW